MAASYPQPSRLTDACPDVRVRIHTGSREELMRQLRTGRIDLILARVSGNVPQDTAFERLTEVRLFLAAPDGHKLAPLARPVTLNDLEPYGWILVSGAGPTAVHLEQLSRRL